jgi:hypothetical protein
MAENHIDFISERLLRDENGAGRLQPGSPKKKEKQIRQIAENKLLSESLTHQRQLFYPEDVDLATGAAILLQRCQGYLHFVLLCATKFALSHLQTLNFRKDEALCSASHSPGNHKLLGNRTA